MVFDLLYLGYEDFRTDKKSPNLKAQSFLLFVLAYCTYTRFKHYNLQL